MSFTLEEMNREEVFLVQACLTRISNNFLYVELIPDGDGLVIRIALEREDPEDREAIEDIETYDIRRDDVQFRTEVLVAPKHPYSADEKGRAIWVRKRPRRYDEDDELPAGGPR